MNLRGEMAPPGSYWGRFVPASIALVALAVIVSPLPLLNSVGAIVIPAALMVLFWSRSESSIYRWFPALVAATVAALAFQPIGLVVIIIVAAGILLDKGVRAGWDWKVVGLAGSCPLLFWLALVLPVWSQTVETIGEEMELTYVAPLTDWFVELGFDQVQMEELVTQTVETVMRLLPSQLVLAALFMGFGALLVGNWWLRRQGRELGIEVQQMAVWALPYRLIWVMIAALASLVFASGGLKTVGLNVVVVLGFFYMVQGFAIIWYSFEVRGTPGWIRSLFAIAVALVVWPGLVIIGMLENWIPFRSLMAKAAGEGEEEDQ